VKVLVCGSRDWTDNEEVWVRLDELNRRLVGGITVLIHGEARGADTFAGEWACERKVHVLSYPAEWTKYGKQAGPIRNRQMLQGGQPGLVVAFSEELRPSSGTWNMVNLARRADVPVLWYRGDF